VNIGGSSSIYTISKAQSAVASASERISSGKRINSAADDAAGLVIGNRLTRQISGFEQSVRNANEGISYLQSAGSGLSSITEGLQHIRELAIQAANGTLNDSDRKVINDEAQQISGEIDRTVKTTSFNQRPLLSGGADQGNSSSSNALQLQVGAEKDETLLIDIGNFDAQLQNLSFQSLDLSSVEGANVALSLLDNVQAAVDKSSATIGAGFNRIESTINNLSSSEISVQASRSRIEDADIAKEVSELAANQVKQQASIAMQVQANQRGSLVLKLLG
jgi:flagellin